MSFYQPDRILADTFIDCVEYHPTLDSTNTLAVELRDELRVRSPALVLTDEQTSGRGRGNHSWWSTGGALTCSVVLDAEQHGPPPASRPLAALASGLAVRSLIAELVPDHDVLTKWPNDVLVADQKIGGILSEQHATSAGSVLVIGIGLNLNNSLASAPDEFRQRATSVFDLTGHSVDLTDTLVRLLGHLRESLEELHQNPSATIQACAQFNRLHGQDVTIETPVELVRGTCRGITGDGALLLDVGHMTREIRAGTVVEFT